MLTFPACISCRKTFSDIKKRTIPSKNLDFVKNIAYA